ncbi:armadillo-type protein [Hygrophoropsis aurantiaca]|uniref:Armadillo-type protein n=1 Tax=Hygrophoropsis aurantiaca TaxID=72124 RepID=A0ACB8A4Q2_9AGAM|nr:armadillo-type protein [Hygrophoropsis aurantiaca]
METFFGRKKARPRQSSVSGQDLYDHSVPYDKLGPPSRTPVPVGTVSQGLRGTPSASTISAPLTNPTLTSYGTDLNFNAIQRSRAERERMPVHGNSITRPDSSFSTADSSTLYNESVASAMGKRPKTPNSRQKIRRSEASTSSGMRSPSGDFGSIPLPSSPSISNTALRPMSAADSHSSHLSHHFFKHVNGNQEEFNFPRPEKDEDIEALFDHLSQTRAFPPMLGMSIDQKWTLVHGAEHLRWQGEKNREEQVRKQGETGLAAPISEGTPEWYIRKFLDHTITPKQATSVWISLKSHETSWLESFLDLHGTSVLANSLLHISRKGSRRSPSEIALENEIAKCLKVIFNNTSRVREALKHNGLVTQIASSLNAPHLSTRKGILEVLLSIIYCSKDSLRLVLQAFEALSAANSDPPSSEPGGCYDYWFKSFETALIGRGKMGSLVGASDEIKKGTGNDSSLVDYALANMFVLVRILDAIEDLEVRIHHRAMMDACGLQRIIAHCRELSIPPMNKQLDDLKEMLDEDEQKLRERFTQEALQDMGNAEDVWKALCARTDNSRAKDYFLSILQHLLLIGAEGPEMVKYYQLLDSIVTDVVMDNKLAGAERRIGNSVQQLIGQLNEAERYQLAIDDAAEARAQALRLKLEKEALEEEVGQGYGGLVGQLKEKVTHLEQKLGVARETTSRLQGQMEAQKVGYEEQIAQLEAQIMELFRMLKEVGKGVERIIDSNSGSMDRRTLIDTLNKHLERTKTINILEGTNRRKKGKDGAEEDGESDASEDNSRDETPRKSSLKRGLNGFQKGSKSSTSTRISQVQSGRASQFMDADAADEREQMHQQLAAGVKILSPQDGPMASPRSIRGSPRRTNRHVPGDDTPSLPRSYRSNNLLAPRPDDSADHSDYEASTRGDDQDGETLFPLMHTEIPYQAHWSHAIPINAQSSGRIRFSRWDAATTATATSTSAATTSAKASARHLYIRF